MKKQRFGALALTLAMAGAVAIPTTIISVRATEAVPYAASENQIPQNIGELEEYYENLVKRNYEAEVAEDKTSERDGDAATGVVRGADTTGAVSSHGSYTSLKGQGRNYWNVNDINPAYDNVTLSYRYTSTSATSVGPQGFGFRFTLGNKHVAILRFQRALSIVQYDTESVGTVNVKISADPYFANIRDTNNAAAGVLPAHVNSGNYTTVVATSNSGKNNGTAVLGKTAVASSEVSGGMPAISAGVGPYGVSGSTNVCVLDDTISVVHTLRKVTDEEGNVTYRFYEDGNYYCSFEFEEEVTGYAPHLAAPGLDYLSASEIDVTLNDPYTELDETRDAGAALQKVFLEVGDTVIYKFVRRAQSNPGPMIYFAYGDDYNNGVNMYRFSARLHLSPWTNRARAGTRSVYVKSDPSNQGYKTDKDSGDFCNVDGVQTMSGNVDGSFDIAQNHTSNHVAGESTETHKGYESDSLTYKIKRLPNEQIGDKTYAMYEVHEDDKGLKSNNGDLYLANIGFPLDDLTYDGVTLYAGHNSGNTPDMLLTMETTAWDDLDDPERDATEEIVWEEWEDASVRYMADLEGLRFTASIKKTLIDMYNAYPNVKFGIKLVRNEGEADEASAMIEAVNYSEKDGKYVFNGVVKGITDYTATYTPYVYIQYEDGGTQTVLTEAGTAQSLRAVAQATLQAIENGLSATETDLKFYSVTVNGKSGYSNYSQKQIDLLKQYV